MKTKLQGNSLEQIQNSIKLYNKGEKSLNIEELVESCIILCENNDYENASKIIDELITHQNKNGSLYIHGEHKSSIPLLKALTHYLNKFAKEKKDVKKYLKNIRNAVSYLEEQLDEHFLLLSNLHSRETIIPLKDNTDYLTFSDGLLEILNTYDFVKESDKIFMLKGKIEVGFERYLYNKDYNTYLKYFTKKGEFEECNSLDIIRLSLALPIMVEKKKLKISKLKSEIENTKDISSITTYLLYIKRDYNSHFSQLYKKYKPLFKEFARDKMSVKEYDKYKTIAKSINKGFEEEIKTLKNESIVLRNLNSISVAINVYYLEKNE